MTDRRSPGWRLFVLMIGAIALLGLVAAAACNDDDDGGNGDGNGDPTATMDDGDGDGDSDGSSLTDLASFGDDYESFNGRITYNITSFAAEGGVASITIYQKDGKSRFDISSEDGDITFISTPDATFLCAEGGCLQYSPDDNTASAGVDAFASIFSADTITEGIGDIPAGVDVDVTSETIAGIDATCFKYSGDLDPDQAGNEGGEFCFSEGGLLLRLAFQGVDESSSFEATSASEDVPDSDFDPPFPVTDLSDLSDLFQP